MSKTHLVIPDSHAHPKYHNRRAEYLGRFIADLKPDVVVHLGDSADMPSLSQYDRGKKSFQGRTYRADVDAHLDWNDRLWTTVKKSKKKLPHRIIFEGNHEERIRRAINLQPELDGAIGISDLEMERYYDEFVEYDGSTPGTKEIDGIHYCHYAISGVMGRPISGEHPAYSLLAKKHASITVGHSHTADYCIRHHPSGRPLHGLVAGCYFDYESDWAGSANDLYWRGVVVKRNVDRGHYDPQFISLAWLKKNYG